jgi:hypothetical protein
VTQSTLLLDEQGWSEIATLLNETLSRANEIAEEAASRLAEEKSDPITTSLAMLHFEKAPAKKK